MDIESIGDTIITVTGIICKEEYKDASTLIVLDGPSKEPSIQLRTRVKVRAIAKGSALRPVTSQHHDVTSCSPPKKNKWGGD